MSTIPTIGRAEIQALLDRRARLALVEALPPRYYLQGHLPGAVNLPHDQVVPLAPGLLPDKAATIVTYCAGPTCPNSTIAAKALIALGYADVRAYEGGKQDWIEAGLPIETGAAALPLAV